MLDMGPLPAAPGPMVAARRPVAAQVPPGGADIGARRPMMADQGHPDHQLKRIVLPSGKTIEVVYFEHPAAAPPEPEVTQAPEAAATPVEAPSTDRLLHMCLDCD